MRLCAPLWDDFYEYVDTQRWTKGGSGNTVAIASAASNHCGVLTIATGASSNNEAWVATTNPLVLLAAGHAFYAEALVEYAEVGTNNAQVAFGLADSFGTGLLGNTGTPSISNTGSIIYKITGGTTWGAYSKNGSTTFTSAGIAVAAPDTAYHTLGILGRVVDTSNYELTYFVDGMPLLDTSTRPNKIKHLLPYASAVNMNLGFYVKTATTSALTLNVDLVTLDVFRGYAPGATNSTSGLPGGN